jgi:hypothetical protein
VKRVSTRLAGLVVVAGLGLVLAACGGDSPSMTGDASTQLRERVTAVRTAVETRDADGAASALDALRQAVDHLRRDDALSDERAADILAAASAVDDQLVTITTTTTTTTTTTVPTPQTEPERGPGPKDDPAGKEGKGGKGPH